MKMVKVDSESEGCLNRDVIIDILSRVPAKPLLSMKCISRGWHNIISNSSFIKAQLQKSELVLNGFIVQDRYTLNKHDIKTVSYIPVEQKYWVRVVHQRVFDFLPEEVIVLATCKGIVCCRSCLPSPNPTLYLCNPLNKEWIQLDWSPPFDVTESIALAFDLELSKFKLVRLKQQVELNNEEDEDEKEILFTFELYCSETKAWRKSAEICNCKDDLIKNKGIYIGGFLHWLTEGDQIITFDVENEMSLLIPVPIPSANELPACIGEYDGKLHYVQISEQCLHVWCLEDLYEFKWILKHRKLLEDFEVEYPRFFPNLRNRVLKSEDTDPWMNPLGFKDGKLLIKVAAEIYIYDMKKDKMAHACSFLQLKPKSMSHPTVFPLSLTLASLKGV